MAETRHRNQNWNIGHTLNGVSWNQVQCAVLMDIRDELQAMNAILHCSNFLAIPHKLDAIKRNTAKRKARRP
jgi:hypothetical protein